jgi:hypothetical protein
MQGNGRDTVTIELHEAIAGLADSEPIECELALRVVAKKFAIPATELRKAVTRHRRTRDARRELTAAAVTPPGSALDVAKILEEAAKPEFVVETANLPAAADAVRDLLAAAGRYFEWGTPAKVVSSGDDLPQIVPLTVDAVVNEVHRLRRPIEAHAGREAKAENPARLRRQALPRQAGRVGPAVSRGHHHGTAAACRREYSCGRRL